MTAVAPRQTPVPPAWNATDVPYDLGRTLHALVDASVRAHADAPALCSPRERLTYRELDRSAEAIAGALRDRGVGRGDLVGICAGRSGAVVAALLGTLRAGAAFVPFDESSPPARLGELIRDARPACVLHGGDVEGRLAAADGGAPLLGLERMPPEANAASFRRVPCGPHDRAYVIYTSGSTGRPKGVEIDHRGIVNRLLWMQDAFGLAPGERVLHKTPLTFDVSVWEVFWPLLAGATIVPAVADGHRDPDHLAELIERFGVTTAHFVPSMLQAFVASGRLAGCRSLRRAICSGEALAPSLARAFRRESGAELHNLYGPTEASIDVTHHPVPAPVGVDVPIGRPIANTQIHVLDDQLRPVAVGEEGEICIAGVGLATGYLHRPALTAERFVPNPLGRGRLYRTGDLGCWRADGTIAFHGRRDGQVKVRGYRVELGEVEAAIARVPGVAAAAVAVEAGQRLAALVEAAPDAALETAALGVAAARVLPGYMVPARFVAVARLPRLTSGKLDRAAVGELLARAPAAPPAPGAAGSGANGPAAAAWRQVLGREHVRGSDDFFHVGGDSIRSLEVVLRLRRQGYPVSVRDVFRHPVLDAFEAWLKLLEPIPEQTPTAVLAPFALLTAADRARVPAGVVDAFPLSSLLSTLVLESHRRRRATSYATSVAIALPLDRERLQHALDRVVARHPFLRSTIDVNGFDEALQLVHAAVAVPLEATSWRRLPVARQQRRAAALLKARGHERFDWQRPPLLRVEAAELAEDRFLLTLTEPFLDGWSATLTLVEILSAYAGRRGVEHGPPGAGGYADFVAAERAAVASRATAGHWRDWLARHVDDAPGIDAEPLEAPRPRTIDVPLEPAVDRGLRALAAEAGVPLKSALLAVHARVAALLSGRDAPVVGLMTNARVEHGESHRVVGLHLNALPLRLPIEGASWIELARRARDAESELLPHRAYPLAQLVRDAGRPRLFDFAFNFTHFHPYERLVAEAGVPLLELRATDQTFFPLTAQFQLTPLTDRLALRLERNGELRGGVDDARLAACYRHALATAARAPHASSDARRLTRRDRRLLARANATAAPQADTTLPELLARCARAHPGAVAIAGNGTALTYAELWRRVERIARGLRAERVGRGARVVVALPRTPDALVAIAAVQQAGAAYVPLSPEDPPARLRRCAEHVGAGVALVAQTGESGRFGAARELTLADAETTGAAAPPAPAPPLRGEDLSHVLFTSGSTGEPKAVLGTHAAVVNRLAWMWRRYPWKPGERLAQQAPLTFVDSLWELFGGLLQGVPTTILATEDVADPPRLLALLEHERITRLTLVPSLARPLFGLDVDLARRLRRLRVLTLSGEPLPGDLARRARAALPHARILNLYGCTEVAADCTAWEVDGGEHGPVAPIGRPIDNLEAHVVDDRLMPVPVGARGELLVTGAGLARGYADAALSEHAFVQWAPPGERSRRAFRTGDLVRRRADGALEHLGRRDRQLKVRGVRVEPAEVEARLLEHPQVREAVVVARDGAGHAGQQLAAYVAGCDETVRRELRAYIARALPAHCVPDAVVALPALPRTSTGKLARGALPDPWPEAPAAESGRDGWTPLERHVGDIWGEVLGVAVTDRHAGFFSLGGQSLKALALVGRLRRSLDAELGVAEVFDHPTVAQLARLLAARGGACRA